MIWSKTAYEFRLYPNKQHETVLGQTLDTCRHLYNLALEDRRTSYENGGFCRSYEDQAALLIIEKKNNLNLNAVFSQVLQDVLRRLDNAFKNFFSRAKDGRSPSILVLRVKDG